MNRIDRPTDVNTATFEDLARIIARHTPREDGVPTAIPDLFLIRKNAPSAPSFCSQWPTFALVAQGAKSITLGQETFDYGVGDFMVVSLDLPVIGRIIKATAEQPMLAMAITIRPERVRMVMDRLGARAPAAAAEGLRAVGVNRVSAPLADAALRYLRLLDTPEDIPVLGALLEQEILYRLLTGPYGPRLIQNATMDSPGNRVARAVEWLRQHFGRTLRMEDLAAHAGMSVSSLHHHFRAVTAMTPMQYQKQLRLNEARRLMLFEKMDAGSAGFAVGYASRSQFGLEYTRHFGIPPKKDVTALRSDAPPIPVGSTALNG
jgi:AraC-like DNA-binding protein